MSDEWTDGLMSRLRRASLLPRKSLGQHFLHDPGLLAAIVDAAELPHGASVLEIGCGPGTLTRQIARVAARVLTVEVDPRMAAFARTELRDIDTIEWLVEDALDGSGGLHPRLLEALADLGPFHWISNLPYAVGTPLISAVLASGLPWRTAALTLQLEVAQRLGASPAAPGDGARGKGAGRDAYGPLSVLVAARARARVVRRIPRGAFLPAPRVESAVVRLDPLESAAVASGEDFRLLRDWVHALFRHRRKQIGGLLRQLLGADAAAEALARGGWSERLRAENLALDDFLLLAREFPLKTL